MDLQLQDKLAFISGSTKGIGKEIAKTMLQEGCRVIINGRSNSAPAHAELSAYGKVYAVEGDLSKAEDCSRICTEIDAIGALDILVNNTGLFVARPFEEITDQDWQELIDINVMSTVRMSRYFFPKMLKKEFGRVIHISSEAGMRGLESMVHYSATKATQLAIGRGMANLTHGCGKNVTVNCVLPGPTMTEGVARWLKESAEVEGKTEDEFVRDFFSATEPDSLLQRFIKPEEIASVVAFIASPLSAAINGSSVKAEGGLIKTIA